MKKLTAVLVDCKISMADHFDDLHSPVTRQRSEEEEEEYQNAKLIRIESGELYNMKQ